MTLRLRLVLGYAYLVALVLVTAVSAIAGFVELSRGIDRVLADNVRSIEASMAMLESLERQDSATLSALLGADREPGSAAELSVADDAFRAALADAFGNITEDHERSVLIGVQLSHQQLVAARDGVVARAPEQPLRAYEEEIFPLFQAVKTGVRRLLDINHEAMQRADRGARTSALRSGAWIAFLVSLAVVSLVLLSRALQQRVLERLAAVREVSKALAAGDTKRRVVLSGDDELTDIGCRLNEILDRRDETEGQWQGRLAVAKRLALALFEHLDPGGTVFALDGTVLIEGDRGGRSQRQKIGRWLRANSSNLVEELASAAGDDLVRQEKIGGKVVTLELLRTGPARPVAWWWRS